MLLIVLEVTFVNFSGNVILFAKTIVMVIDPFTFVVTT